MKAKYTSYGVLSAVTLAVAGAYSLPAAAHDTKLQDSNLASTTQISAKDVVKSARTANGSDDALARVDVDSGSTHIHADIVTPTDRSGKPSSFVV